MTPLMQDNSEYSKDEIMTIEDLRDLEMAMKMTKTQENRFGRQRCRRYINDNKKRRIEVNDSKDAEMTKMM